MARLRQCSVDFSNPMPSPLLKERFCNSSRHGTRPSTFSTVSFLGSERSPRFYEKVMRWFRQKRGRNMSSEHFPTEKHSNAHHNAVLVNSPLRRGSCQSPALGSRRASKLFNSPKHPLLLQSSLSTSTHSEGPASNRSTPTSLHRCPGTDRVSPISHYKLRSRLSSTSSVSSNSNALPPVVSSRGISMESGYQSISTCSSPADTSPSIFKRDRSTRFRFLTRAFKAVKVNGKSLSEEVPENEMEDYLWQSRSQEDNIADGKRRRYQLKEAPFNSRVDEEEVDKDSDELRTESRASSYCNSSVFSGSLSSLTQSDAHEIVAITLGDFRFKYAELEFNQLISSSPRTRVHSGKCQVWDVNIHSYSPRNDEEVHDWLAEVRRLTHIRHENIVLYMGACVEPPKFAIVTSLLKVESVYAHTVIQGARLTAANTLSILRQTANALSYLHCRGIVHGRLSAHNIFLESKVKVSLIDYTPSLLNMQYYSPEIARDLTFSDQDTKIKSNEGDIFAFGTLICQLSLQRLPLDNLPAQAVLYQVGRGKLPNHLHRMQMNPGFARLLERCWSLEPSLRPTFPVICSILQPLLNSVSARKHSLSEPRNLDKLGKHAKQPLFYTEKQIR